MRKRYAVWLFALIMCILSVMPVSAKWVKNKNGYVYYTSKGVKVDTVWVESKNTGIVYFPNGSTYAIRKEGTFYRGCLSVNGKTYYFNSKGLLVKNKWIKGSGGKLFHTDKTGALLTSRTAKIGKYVYGFDRKGVMIKGIATVRKKTYCFHKTNGVMLVKKLVKVGGKLYFFGSDGVLVAGKWVGRYYFDKKGAALTNCWRGERYLGADGKYCVGLTKVGSDIYFFNNNGTKLKSATKTVDGRLYIFDENGKAITNNGRFEEEYYTDPVVSDETLMAAIIFAESGNQPYYGQLAVGLVITNRMRSSGFPNSLKDVIYAKQQFEPARNGALTRYLKNPALISETSKKAAKVVLAAMPLNKYFTTDENGKRISMEGYYFFMTPAAYQRLGLHSAYIRLKDHVFFKQWVK